MAANPRMPLYAMTPQKAARELMLRNLRAAESAARRLAGGKAPEALHDFRVALRRFRAASRAYREWLGPAMPKKLRHKLKEMVNLTGPARDAEVQLAWLAGQFPQLTAQQTPGYDELHELLLRRHRAAYAAVRETVAGHFAQLAAHLRSSLLEPYEESAETFAQAAGSQLAGLSRTIAAGVERMRSAEDPQRMHDTRLLIKRARYLLEPVAAAAAEGKAVAARLAGLQELLGEIHDSDVFGPALAEAAGELGALRSRRRVESALTMPGPSPRPDRPTALPEEEGALLALAGCLRKTRENARGALAAAIDGGESAAAIEGLGRVADALVQVGQDRRTTMAKA
jgi:CHAD domain-containing protein